MAASFFNVGKPPRWMGMLICALLVVIWGVMRLALFHQFIMPLTFLPLMACIWTRDKKVLWAMAVCFVAMITAKVFLIMPQDRLHYEDWAQYAATMANIIAGAMVVHLVLVLRDRLDASISDLRSANDEMTAQSEELAQQNEELVQQGEELSRQNEAMESQQAELRRQTEEIEAINSDLSHREKMLQRLLDSARSLKGEREVMDGICQTALEIMGGVADAAIVLEPRDDFFVACASGGFGDADLPKHPAAGSFADLVLRQNKTASLENAADRPDIRIYNNGVDRFLSALAAPVRLHGRPAAIVSMYSRQPRRWTTEDFQFAEWLAGQCSLILEVIRLQKDLLDREARLRQILESLPQIVWTCLPEGLCDYLSPQWTAYTGKPEKEQLGYGWLQQLHPDDRDRARNAWQSTTESGRNFAIEFRIRRHDGAYRWFRALAVPFHDDSGRIVKWFGSNTDVQDVREAEEERRRSEEKASLLSDVTSQLLASENPQRVVESLCRKVMGHLGCQAFFHFLVDENVGRLRLNAHAGIPEETARELEWLDRGAALCDCVISDGSRMVADSVQIASDTRLDLVRSLGIQAFACHPLMGQGKVLGTLSFGSSIKMGFTQDEVDLMKAVTDHVAIAMQRVQLIKSLDEQVRVAEAANQAKSQFLANMSHELRTPMNAILGMIDVALPKANNPTIQDCLQTAKESAGLLLKLLDDLLDSARIESGKLELESVPFSIRKILDQTAIILSGRANEKGLRFCCRVPGNIPDAVMGDGRRLQQVLVNLAGNAIKFTESGEVEISLEVSLQGGKALLQFSVRDTGIGIPPFRLEQIFEPFAQADSSMSRRFGGSGLGLPISKSLIEMMGGRIWAESEVGKGSAFHFAIQLPLADEVTRDSATPPAIRAAISRRLHILLVEDNPANQKLATYVLRDRGHEIDVAGDGLEAIRMAQRARYDVILLDVQMPGIDGFEATSEIRKLQDGGRRVPIIAMTAHAMKGDRERCLRAGMDSYLAKPVDPREMIGLVESIAGDEPPAVPCPVKARGPGADPIKPSKIFDPDEALERCFSSENMVNEMIGCFLTESGEMFDRMHSALERGDLLEVGRLGHRIKGTVVYLAAAAATEAAAGVERFSTSDGTRAEAEQAIGALERECQALKKALSEFQAKARAGQTPD